MTGTLLCLPHAGGAPSSFRTWPRVLAEGWKLHPITYPGRDRRFLDPLPADLAGYCDDILARERVTLAAAPYAVFGHSFGAMLAWELARRAPGVGLPAPRAIIVSGARAPHVPPRRKPIHGLPDRTLIGELVEMRGMEPEVLASPELLELVLPRIRADLRAAETFVPPREAIDTPILALHGADDPHAGAADAQQWQHVTQRNFECRAFPGGHFYLLEHLPAVVDCVATFLRRHP